MTHRPLQKTHRFLLAALNHDLRRPNQTSGEGLQISCVPWVRSFRIPNNSCKFLTRDRAGALFIEKDSLLAIHLPTVNMSGVLRNEAIASPSVTRGSESRLHAIQAMQPILMKLQQITIIISAALNCNLHCSSTCSLRH